VICRVRVADEKRNRTHLIPVFFSVLLGYTSCRLKILPDARNPPPVVNKPSQISLRRPDRRNSTARTQAPKVRRARTALDLPTSRSPKRGCQSRRHDGSDVLKLILGATRAHLMTNTAVLPARRPTGEQARTTRETAPARHSAAQARDCNPLSASSTSVRI
jgi:hypothetical protein